MARSSAIHWVALACLAVSLPMLDGCAKARVAGGTPTAVAGTRSVAAAAVAGTVTSLTNPVSKPSVEVDAIAEEEAGDDVAAFAAIDPDAGRAAGPQAQVGLSGDTLDGNVALGGATRGTAQSVLDTIAARSDLKVFFSTNSIDRGLLGKRVDLGPSGTETTEAAVDTICRTAGLSCFYAADYRSLSVYDPREFQAQGPDMKALVFDRREGEFEVATAATRARAAAAAAKPGKPKPAAASRKPGKKPVAKPASSRKPAATKPGKPKPAAAKPGKPKPPAAKPKPASTKKPPAVKPKPAATKPAAAKKPPAPAKKPTKS